MNNEVLLTQIQSSMEILVQQLKDNSKNVILNASVRDFENFPNGYYYEKISGEIDRSDLTPNYWYLQEKHEAIKSINLFKLSSPYIASVYYYDKTKDIVLMFDEGSTYKQYAYEQFQDLGWVEPLKDKPDSGMLWLNRRTVSWDGAKAQEVMTLVIRSDGSNVFVINLDAAMLQERLVAKLSKQDNLLIVSNQGNVLFHNRNGSSLPNNCFK